ncbi:MAG: LytTR family transcriptional regulator [Bacteroidaceae bacterium]|nr:LytTR family transcriptional regulator [Bacteroidaceae bacterium]
MLNNPIIFDKYIRQSTIFLCALIGIIYAFVFGLSAHIEIADILTDGLISAIMLFIIATLLWNVYTFSKPNSLSIYQSIILNMLYCLISVIAVTSIESLSAYMIFPHQLKSFAFTLPARIFCLIAMYCATYSFYQRNKVKTEEDDDDDEQDILQNEADTNTADTHTAALNTNMIERITVKTRHNIKVIPVDELIYIKAEDDYVSLVTAEGHWLKNGTMKEYEANLPSDKFVRVHRSYIVNINKITKIERYGQMQLLKLTSDASLRISNNGYKLLREKLNL